LKLWNRTDYRNTPLDSLVPAMRLITERGGFALRMGAIVDQPLDDAGDPKIIDYANLYRSPFMDMFLAKHCRFFIGTASGALMMATVQDVPVISTNHVPYSHFHNHSYDMVLPRLVLDPETEETISYARAQELGFYSDSSPSSKAAQTLDYGWRENDVEDIRNACEDMLRYLDGEPVPAEIAELQTAFARKYLHALPDHDLAAKIAPSWAAKYAEYF
jgi:putative glycosyltransferase (TIGR04372 family)